MLLVKNTILINSVGLVNVLRHATKASCDHHLIILMVAAYCNFQFVFLENDLLEGAHVCSI